MLHLFENYIKDQEKLAITREILRSIYTLSEETLLSDTRWERKHFFSLRAPKDIFGQVQISESKEIEACLTRALFSVTDYERFNALKDGDKKAILASLSSKFYEESLKHESTYVETYYNADLFSSNQVLRKTKKGLSLSVFVDRYYGGGYANSPCEINFPLKLFTNAVELKYIIQQVILDYKNNKYSHVLLNPLLQVGTSSAHHQDIEMRPLKN